MRKLKLQVQMSVDGFIAGPNGEMDWMTWDWDDALKNYVKEITDPVDCVVLGRKLAEGFIPYWAGNPLLEGAAQLNSFNKVVLPKHFTHQTISSKAGPIRYWQKAILLKRLLP